MQWSPIDFNLLEPTYGHLCTKAKMDAIIQLMRNALCCIKDLQLFSGTFLYDPTLVSSSFPAPMNKTTPLELCISSLQLYACFSCMSSGLDLLTNHGINKLRRIVRLASMRTKSSEAHDQIINNSLNAEAVAAAKMTGVGYCTFIIGVAFFWLFANSLHITETGWIGGLPFLIHALSAMEIALIPLLYLMITDGLYSIRKSSVMKKLAIHISTHTNFGEKLTFETFCILQTVSLQQKPWVPFWVKYYRLSLEEEKMLTKEAETVQASLKLLSSEETKKSMKDISDKLKQEAKMLQWVGYRSFLYFILNFIAFYGYLLGILVYYMTSSEDETSSTTPYFTLLLLGMSPTDADWHGNFIGDLMWTVEPIIIIGSPYIFQILLTGRDRKKEKSD